MIPYFEIPPLRLFTLPGGWYVAAACLAYAPVRFLLDFLRVADARYLGLTPGQLASLALLGVGIAVALRVRRYQETSA